MDKKYYCGMYKGHKVYKVGQMIGNNFYGYFYAAKLVNVRYKKDEQSPRETLEELQEYIDERMK